MNYKGRFHSPYVLQYPILREIKLGRPEGAAIAVEQAFQECLAEGDNKTAAAYAGLMLSLTETENDDVRRYARMVVTGPDAPQIQYLNAHVCNATKVAAILRIRSASNERDD
ncbi:MAG: hypothetical protein KF912_06540 [Phycisphaeraceae bacterium]|nr:hypothetical protein [Phycisphaeraceae bacterium]